MGVTCGKIKKKGKKKIFLKKSEELKGIENLNRNISITNNIVFFNFLSKEFNKRKKNNNFNENINNLIEIKPNKEEKTLIKISNGIHPESITENIYKNIKTLFDFQNLYVVSQNSFKLEEISFLINKFNEANVKFKELFILKSNIQKFLEEYSIFSIEKKDTQQFFLPILLFDEKDVFSQITNPKQPLIKNKNFRIFMQSIENFKTNTTININFYEKNLGIENIFVKNLKDFSVKEFQPIYTFNIFDENLSNNKKVMITMEKIYKKGKSLIFLHSISDKNCLKSILLLIEFFLTNKIGANSDNCKFYLESMVPNFKGNTEQNSKQFISFSSNENIDIKMNENTKKEKKSITNNKDNSRKSADLKNVQMTNKPIKSNSFEFKTRCDEMTDLFINYKNKEKNDENVIISYETIHHLLQNIITNPTEDKFKTIKKTNKKLNEAIFKYEETKKLIELCGFSQNKEDNNIFTNIFEISTLKMVRNDLELAFKNSNK